MSFRFAALVFVPALVACPLLDQGSTDLTDGCPTEITFADGCDGDEGGVIVQADCDNGDRWEVLHLVAVGEDAEVPYDYECRLNGEVVEGGNVDFCGLDPDDAADSTQILVRARALCVLNNDDEDRNPAVSR